MGGLYAKETHIPAGTKLTQHVHPFDHLSILASGSVLVRADGWVESYAAPAAITIKAGIAHEVEAATDTVWFCLHATDETDPEKVDHAILGQNNTSAGVAAHVGGGTGNTCDAHPRVILGDE